MGGVGCLHDVPQSANTRLAAQCTKKNMCKKDDEQFDGENEYLSQHFTSHGLLAVVFANILGEIYHPHYSQGVFGSGVNSHAL